MLILMVVSIPHRYILIEWRCHKWEATPSIAVVLARPHRVGAVLWNKPHLVVSHRHGGILPDLYSSVLLVGSISLYHVSICIYLLPDLVDLHGRRQQIGSIILTMQLFITHTNHINNYDEVHGVF